MYIKVIYKSNQSLSQYQLCECPEFPCGLCVHLWSSLRALHEGNAGLLL